MGEVENSLSLFGKRDFLSLRVDEISSVKFSRKIDEGQITRFVGLEKKLKVNIQRLFIRMEVLLLKERFSLILIRSTK